MSPKLVSIAIALLAWPLLAATPQVAPEPGGRNAALATLEQRVEALDWPDATPDYVFEWLRKQGAANVTVNWAALAVEGVDQSSPPVTLRMRQATVAEVLNEVLPQLSDTHAVRYRAAGRTIRISTESDFNRRLYVRVYDITDLVILAPRFTDGPEINVGELRAAGTGSGETAATPFTSSASSEDGDSEDNDRQRAQELQSLIEGSVHPNHWDTQGGRGSIRLYNNTLVVRASIEVHEEIGGLFRFGG